MAKRKKSSKKTAQSSSGSAKTRAKAKNNSKSVDSTKIPEWLLITDIEQLSALAKPISQKLLAEFVDQARTTKQVADRLGEPPTRLYHHVDALAQHGLLVLEREVPKRGTTEKYYRAVAKHFRVDDQCLTQPEFLDENARLVSQMLDDARLAILQSLSDTADEEETAEFATALSTLINTTEKGIERVSEALLKQLTRYSDNPPKGSKQDERKNYRVTILIYPEPEE